MDMIKVYEVKLRMCGEEWTLEKAAENAHEALRLAREDVLKVAYWGSEFMLKTKDVKRVG